MTAVHASTDQLPGLQAILDERHRLGLDTYDEWWEGTYRTVTGPSPEHGRLLNKLAILLDPLAEAVGLHTAAPLNIGLDKVDARVPDLAVYRPDTPRTSPAFLTTALLVVEILSPSEIAGEKLPFYAAHGVQEYLEIDLRAGRADLLLHEGDDAWTQLEASDVLDFRVQRNTVDPGYSIKTAHGRVNLYDYRA